MPGIRSPTARSANNIGVMRGREDRKEKINILAL